AEIVRLFRALDPPSLERLTNTAVTFNAVERGAGLDGPGQGVASALYRADLDYELFDLESGECVKPLLVYAGGRWLSHEHHGRLSEYIQGGGTLVCLQPPTNLLGSGAPVGVTSVAPPHRLRIALGSSAVTLSSDAVYLYETHMGEALTGERVEPLPPTQEGGHLHLRLPLGERLCVGYVEPRGRGRL